MEELISLSDLKEAGICTNSKTLLDALNSIKQAFADQDFLDCLKAVGVNNWEGYAEACEMYEE